ncbi:MAG: hypothetical protein IKM44_00220 [Clostridia bacterium]|nr:hypothetical protein [Clostridia bacterium]
MQQKICEDCGKRPAVYHMKNIINGVYTEHYLCAECKEKRGFITPDFGLNNLFSAFGNPFATLYGTQNKKIKCSKCGYNIQDFLKSGYLGCPDCYEAFSEQITPTLAKMQRDTKHTGKTPKEFYSAEDTKYNELLRQREEAVAKEDYLLAGRINEEMKKLKGGA